MFTTSHLFFITTTRSYEPFVVAQYPNEGTKVSSSRPNSIANSTKDTEFDELRIVVISRDLHIRSSTCFPKPQRLAWWLQP